MISEKVVKKSCKKRGKDKKTLLKQSGYCIIGIIRSRCGESGESG